MPGDEVPSPRRLPRAVVVELAVLALLAAAGVAVVAARDPGGTELSIDSGLPAAPDAGTEPATTAPRPGAPPAGAAGGGEPSIAAAATPAAEALTPAGPQNLPPAGGGASPAEAPTTATTAPPSPEPARTWGPGPGPTLPGPDYGPGCTGHSDMPCDPDPCHQGTAVQVRAHWQTWPDSVNPDSWVCI